MSVGGRNMKDLLLMRAPLKYIQGKDALKKFYENSKDFGKKLGR